MVSDVVGLTQPRAYSSHRYGNKVLILGLLDLAVMEEARGGRDARCRLRRSALLANDDLLLLDEKYVGLNELVHTVLAQREHDVHDREREQDVCVSEDASQLPKSVGKVGFLDERRSPLSAGPPVLAPSLANTSERSTRRCRLRGRALGWISSWSRRRTTNGLDRPTARPVVALHVEELQLLQITETPHCRSPKPRSRRAGRSGVDMSLRGCQAVPPDRGDR